MLNRAEKYEIGKNCFKYLTRIKPNDPEAYCGQSMCCVELGEMDSGFKCAELAVKKAEKNDTNMPLYNYLAALCSKAIESLNASKYYYDNFKLATTGIKPNEIKNFIFGLFLSNLMEDKGLVKNSVSRYESLYAKLRSQFREARTNKTGLEKYCNTKGKWISLKTSKILTILKEKPFFCRYSEAQLIKVISFSSYKDLPGDNLLLISQSDVAVILAGKAILCTYTKGLINHEVITQCGKCWKEE
jgi:hypothetical protein